MRLASAAFAAVLVPVLVPVLALLLALTATTANGAALRDAVSAELARHAKDSCSKSGNRGYCLSPEELRTCAVPTTVVFALPGCRCETVSTPDGGQYGTMTCPSGGS